MAVRTLRHKTDDMLGQRVEAYPPNFSDASLVAMMKWSKDVRTRCPRFSKWLLAFAGEELQRRARHKRQPEARIYQFDEGLYAVHELIFLLTELHAIALATRGACPALFHLAQTLYARCAVEAEARVRRGEL